MPLPQATRRKAEVGRCILSDIDAEERGGALLLDATWKLDVLELLNKRAELVIEQRRLGRNPGKDAVALRRALLQRAIARDEKKAEELSWRCK